MNFRVTTFLFALLLATLWLFGLMIAHKKTAGDAAAMLPSLSAADAKVDKIQVKRTTKTKEGATKEEEHNFVQIGDQWFYKQGEKKVRVEGFRIDSIIRQLKEARSDETADVSRSADYYGMTNPEMVVTLTGKHREETKEWTLTMGKQSPDTLIAYVTSSEKSDRVYAIPAKHVEPLLFKDPQHFRSKRVFDTVETAVSVVQINRGAADLEVRKSDEGNIWSFVKPPLGPVGFESEAPEEKKDPFHKIPPKKSAPGGVKGLLTSILEVRVEEDEDFEPFGNRTLADYGLAPGKESMKIDLGSLEKKALNTETLYIGEKVRNRTGEFYYAKLASDDGVMQINAKWLEPLQRAVEEPGKLRSLDVAVFDESKVDVIVINQGKTEYKFYRAAPAKEKLLPFEMEPEWQLAIGGKLEKVGGQAVLSLLQLIQGKKAISEFHDIAEADLKKREAELGLDAPAAEIAVYVGGIDRDAKPKEEKKEDDPKKDQPKKDEKKDEMPKLKDGAKPVVTLAVGKVEKELVNVRRTLEDGTTKSRFAMKKEILEKVVPTEGMAVAYMDTALPAFPPQDVVSMKLQRVTDKGSETLEMQRHFVEGKVRWYIKDALAPSGLVIADTEKVHELAVDLGTLRANKWLREFGEKEDLEALGLKSPSMVITATVKKNPFLGKTDAERLNGFVAAGALFGGMVGSTDAAIISAVTAFTLRGDADKGEVVTLEIGKEKKEEKGKGGYYARHSGSKLLFLMQSELVKFTREQEYRDRSAMLYSVPQLEALNKAASSINAVNALLFLSPHYSGQVHRFDPEKVKEVRMEIRNPFELRSFHFIMDAKEKTWSDKSNLKEFQLDSEKVAQMLKDVSKLRTERFVAYTGGPRTEHKLGPKDASVKLDMTLEDGSTITLTVGPAFGNLGHFANTSYWPEAVFFVPATTIEPILQGARFFAKERSTGN